MINLVLALALRSSHGDPTDQWVTKLLASQPAQAVISKATRRQKPTVDLPDRVVEGAHLPKPQTKDGEITILGIDLKPIVDAERHATDLLEAGKAEEAYTFMSSFRENHFAAHIFLDLFVIDCELLSGRYQEAYEGSVNYIKNNTGPSAKIGEDAYLKLSLAAAGCGQVIDGQIEYCTAWFQKNYSEGWSGGHRAAMLTTVDGSRKAMVLSTLALAVSTTPTQPYLESVLKLDPTNDLAGRMLVDYDRMQGRYSDLRRISTFMTLHLSDPKSRSFYSDQISSVAGLADRTNRKWTRAAP